MFDAKRVLDGPASTRSEAGWPRYFLLGSISFTALPAFAGPPFLTDDPEPVAAGHHEFYIASQQVKTQDGRTGTLPHLEYNYGAAPDLHLHLIVPFAFNHPADAAAHSGLGDIELGIKYRLAQETESRPMVGIFPIFLTPTGNEEKGLGNGDTQFFLPVWLQKRWGSWQSYGGGGYWINNAANGKNHWFYGWQLQKDVSEALMLGGEIFYSGATEPGEASRSGFNLGGVFSPSEHHHLLFSAGKGLKNVAATNKFSSFVAYQLTW